MSTEEATVHQTQCFDFSVAVELRQRDTARPMPGLVPVPRAGRPQAKSVERQDEVLAIIPARGGSKGIPRKNIRPLCGKPLVAYSIEVALKARNIDRVIVSTEDEEIAEISRSFGADVPFLRPRELAGDASEVGETLSHVRMELEKQGRRPKCLAVLYPTHPFRTVSMLEHLVDKLLSGYASVSTVKAVQAPQHGYFFKQGQGRLEPLKDFGANPAGKWYCRRQGYFYGTNCRADTFRSYIHRLEDTFSLIDIDTNEDFYLAEEIVRQDLFDFEV